MPNPGLGGRQNPELQNPTPCAKCGKQKSFKEFTFKNDRNNYDKTCAACRKGDRSKNSSRRPACLEDDQLDELPSKIEMETTGPSQSLTRLTTAEIEQEEFDRAVRIFQLLKKWHDEALAYGPIKGWRSL